MRNFPRLISLPSGEPVRVLPGLEQSACTQGMNLHLAGVTPGGTGVERLKESKLHLAFTGRADG